MNYVRAETSLLFSLRFTFCPDMILTALPAPVRQTIIPDFTHTEV